MIPAYRGLIIAFEGIDGVGKTTAVKHIAKKLESLGIPHILLKEPTNSIYGQKIRDPEARLSAEEELRLFIEDRKLHVKEKILPALAEGKVILMDRYYLTTVAYQGARGLDPEEIKRINEQFAPKPDLVILLDAAPETALKRIEKRGKRERFENPEYLKKVRELFLKHADSAAVVNAERDLSTVLDEIEKRVLDFLRERGMLDA